MRKLSRRAFNLGALATLLVGPGAYAQKVDELQKTPSQGEGPFYPLNRQASPGNTLVRVDADGPLADGDLLRLGGRVMDAGGRPRPGLTVDIWQVDHRGIYNHPGDSRYSQRDPRFRGYGESTTDGEGRYEFTTLLPAVYPGRPPHIHVKLWDGNREVLTTQLYIKGHPLNQRDGMFMWLFGLGSTGFLQFEPRPAGRYAGRPLQSADFDFVV